MHIVYISDGKAGHRSQALGLFNALQRQTDAALSFQEIAIHDLPFVQLVSAVFKKQHPLVAREPALIIGVGSHTQLRVLLLGKVYSQAKTAILMKPNFPYHWFDYAVIPEHDDVPASQGVLLTQGALNPIVNERRHLENRILIALGGSSKRHQWNEEKILEAVQAIAAGNPKAEIILTTSRRTPKEFLTHLSQLDFLTKLQVFPVEETPQGWIFEQMQQAEAVWVTEDSVSMIYEALTAGCKVGVIAVDRIKTDRIVRSVDALLHRNVVSASARIEELPAASVFSEAENTAKRIALDLSHK